MYVDGEMQDLHQVYTRDTSGIIRELDGKYITFYKISPKYKKRSKWVTPAINDSKSTKHPKGEIGEAKYYYLMRFPLHRILYIWFYDDLKPDLDVCHIDHNWANNNISNLKQDTHRNNLLERRGSINQYGKRLSERNKEAQESADSR